jgi:hypothetical protein
MAARIVNQNGPATNNIFAPGGFDVWFKVLLSLFRLVSWTGSSFKIPPDRKYSRWAQWPVRFAKLFKLGT